MGTSVLRPAGASVAPGSMLPAARLGVVGPQARLGVRPPAYRGGPASVVHLRAYRTISLAAYALAPLVRYRQWYA